MPDTDFHTMLARRIAASQGSSLSRQDIYAAARAALKKQAVLHRPYLSIDEIHRYMDDLEAAISRLEAKFPDADARPEPPGEVGDVDTGFAAEIDAPIERLRPVNGSPAFEVDAEADTTPVVEPPSQRPNVDHPPRDLIVRPPHYVRDRDVARIYDVDLLPLEPEPRRVEPPPSATRRILAGTALLVQLTIASLAGVSLYALLSGQGLPGLGGHRADAPVPAAVPATPTPASAPTETRPMEPPSEGRIALPSLFGVYALRDGRLIELEPVMTEPVDPRAKHLQQIIKPARTVLPDGKVIFLVFRRELIVNAPERIPVRFAAKLSRLMSFDPQGKAVWTSPAKDTWLIRDAGFDFRVMPVKESPEMVYVRAENPDFTLPAGRYALMVGDKPYDFVVEGPVTDPGHCVEGSATMRGPVFYECKPS